MTELDRLRTWSDENLLASFELLLRHPPRGEPVEPRRFGSATAFATGRRSGFLNAVVILAPAEPRDVEAAVGSLLFERVTRHLDERKDAPREAAQREASSA